MQSWEEMEELEALGQTEEPWEPESGGGSGEGLSTVPLLQALVCVLLLAGLLTLRQSGHPAFEKIQERYRQEAAQEWRLPDWKGGEGISPSPSPAPTPGPSPAPAGLPGVEVQRL